MTDPVIAADGHTYERAALRAWLAHNSTSPVTGQPLLHTRITDNFLIKSAIARHKEQDMLCSLSAGLQQDYGRAACQ